MSGFDPLAIVGRGCVLPGANDPSRLWSHVLAGDDLTGPTPPDAWGVDPAVACASREDPVASAWGGYISGFASVWHDDRFALAPSVLASLPEGWRWLLHATRAALDEASIGRAGSARSGLVLGALAYPSREYADALASRWSGRAGAARTPLPGQAAALHTVADACGIGGARLVLDAACASALYALKTGADWLHAHRVDQVVVAGATWSDSLLLHAGFTAAGALSPSGRCSPLSRAADGLLPAVGATAIVMKRLADAIANGDRILAIVRGVSVGNDGRGRGLLAPDTAGQQRVVAAAWEAARLAPESVEFLECHATGTPVGDREELRTIEGVFGRAPELRIGTLKAQVGHLLAASAGASLLKVCGALESSTFPPLARCAIDDPMPELASSGLRRNAAPEAWTARDGPRRAAINAFGFGGCNAHAILDGPEAAPQLAARRPRSARPAANAAPPYRAVVTAVELLAGGAQDSGEVLRVLRGDAPPTAAAGTIVLPLEGLGAPPAEVARAVPAQLLLLRAATRLDPALAGLDRTRVGVFVGAEVDPAVARYLYRWRLQRWHSGRPTPDDRAAVTPPLSSSDVPGTMPNLPANRLNSALRLAGPGFVVADGDASGLRALERAHDAIGRGVLDAAIVGAVDAGGRIVDDDADATDVAVLVVLRRGDAGAATALAELSRDDAQSAAEPESRLPLPWRDLGVARGLFELGVAVLGCAHGFDPRSPAVPWPGDDRACTIRGWRVRAGGAAIGLCDEPPESLRLVPPQPRLAAAAAAAGGVAIVFTGAAAAYPGAGRALWRALPALPATLAAAAPAFVHEAGTLMASAALDPAARLHLATALSQSHALLLSWLGVRPDAMLGMSSGETNALVASGAWNDLDTLFGEIRASGMYERHLAGEYAVLRRNGTPAPAGPAAWRCYRVRRDEAAVRAAIEAVAPADPARVVRIVVVHHASDLVIAGAEADCLAVVDALGATAIPLDYDVVVHCPELRPFAEAWTALHRRPTRPVTSPRLYANATHAVFVPEQDRCAALLLAQALDTVRFDATIEQAWADGIRVFIEAGPRSVYTGIVREILGDRPHVAVALDGSHGSLRELRDALQALLDAGVRVDVTRWHALVAAMEPARPDPPDRPTMTVAPRTAPPTLAARPPRDAATAGAPLPLAPVLPRRLRPQPDLVPEVRAATVRAATVRPATVPAHPVLAALAQTQAALLASHRAVVAMARPREAFASRGAGAPPRDPGRAAPPARLTRADLERLAVGRVADVFGPAFAPLDDFPRPVRMPAPPLLLTDRVLELVGEPASLGTGAVVTETDVTAGSWYLHRDRMPAGILIESGQSDLLLLSWLGVDFRTRGERVYRLLGCDITFRGRLPVVGSTIRHHIVLDGQAQAGDTLLVTFHSDASVAGEPVLQVRGGQAGFFSEEELRAAGGILWDPEADPPPAHAPLASPAAGVAVPSCLEAGALRDLANGASVSALGPGFRRLALHHASPRLPAGEMQLLTRIDAIEPGGGPWQRGYLRATYDITPDAWFFTGHFPGDPVMPGSLMFEGALQAMALYLTALGFTLACDGGVFEPVPDHTCSVRCRGQVTPGARQLTYEVFVAELRDGPVPTLIADVLVTVDGVRALHVRRLGVRVAPAFAPLPARDAAPGQLRAHEDAGGAFGMPALLACALGDPRDAIPGVYDRLPEGRRILRLPAPPFLCMTRVRSVSHPSGALTPGLTVHSECDVATGAGTAGLFEGSRAPLAVVLESMLQPCGWLAGYGGAVLESPGVDVFIRNLDGRWSMRRPLPEVHGVLSARSTLRSASRAGALMLLEFDVALSDDAGTIGELRTTFGLFTAEALAVQTGLDCTPGERELVSRTGAADLVAALPPAHQALVATGPLRIWDRLTHREPVPDGGTRLRAEARVDATAWYFRAHFFQDPVQPGSLGVEALSQLLQAHLLLEGAASAIPAGRFAITAPTPLAWRFRGQVLPESRLVVFIVHADPVLRERDAWTVRARGSLWVDGRRIYEVDGLRACWESAATPADHLHFDTASQPWWNDHRPTWGVPVVPAMALVSAALGRAPRREAPRGVADVVFRRWMSLDRPIAVRLERDARGFRFVDAADQTLYAEGRWLDVDATERPAPFAPLGLSDSEPLGDLYERAEVPHGPAYQRVRSGRRSADGADVVLAIDQAADRDDVVSHFLLDAALHAIPHDALHRWFPAAGEHAVAYPARVASFRLFGPLPIGGTCEARIRAHGFWNDLPRFPQFRVQLLRDGDVWADLTLVEVMLPAPSFAALPGPARRAYLRDREYVPGARLSDEAGGVTRLDAASVARLDWIPGTIDGIYGRPPAGLTSAAHIAALEHAAARLRSHPGALRIDPQGRVEASNHPFLDYRVAIAQVEGAASVHDLAGPSLDTGTVQRWFASQGWNVDDATMRMVFAAATRQFVRGVRLVDPDAIARLIDAPILLLANHQVAVETVMAYLALTPVVGRRVLPLAKEEHRHTWVGRLAVHLAPPTFGEPVTFVDRGKPRDMVRAMRELGRRAADGERAPLVHVEGTRALQGRAPVTTASAAWLDLAVEHGLTVIPVRFTHGLPVDRPVDRQEFPHGYGAQWIVLGRPIQPAALRELRTDARRAALIDALDDLAAHDEGPVADPAFAGHVAAIQARWAIDEPRAVFLALWATGHGIPLDPVDALGPAIAAAAERRHPFWSWMLEGLQPVR